MNAGYGHWGMTGTAAERPLGTAFSGAEHIVIARYIGYARAHIRTREIPSRKCSAQNLTALL
jgi:hypothetical protein